MKNIALVGEADIVVEFFEYSINSILYQRELYSPDCFKVVKKYNLSLFVSQDEALSKYLAQILAQVKVWISTRQIWSLVLVLIDKETLEVRERWQFELNITKENKERKEREIHAEISAIIRQITASVGFLPILPENMTFSVLAYTDRNIQVPSEWIDSDAKLISDPTIVKLRSLNTNDYKIDSMVSYKLQE
ncbi:Mitotic spindle checkpoint component mad2 [Terramyces sp. JEL0728]|nr:Mitotic spindle checkpoint component mad2 [Terramyces sp. JEL0728]